MHASGGLSYQGHFIHTFENLTRTRRKDYCTASVHSRRAHINKVYSSRSQTSAFDDKRHKDPNDVRMYQTIKTTNTDSKHGKRHGKGHGKRWAKAAVPHYIWLQVGQYRDIRQDIK
jgi:hypothetical protein